LISQKIVSISWKMRILISWNSIFRPPSPWTDTSTNPDSDPDSDPNFWAQTAGWEITQSEKGYLVKSVKYSESFLSFFIFYCIYKILYNLLKFEKKEGYESIKLSFSTPHVLEMFYFIFALLLCPFGLVFFCLILDDFLKSASCWSCMQGKSSGKILDQFLLPKMMTKCSAFLKCWIE
jgi:hypothetical protein